LGSNPSHSLQNILQPFKKEGVIFCKPFKMNGKKKWPVPNNTLCHAKLLISKYKHSQRQDRYHSHPYFTFPRNSKLWRFGLYFDACKRLVEEYVQAVIDSLHARFRDMRVFNATKIFSPISYPMELPLLYRNAHLWLQVLLNHFCLGRCRLADFHT
jgi:hypothetical protein